MKKIIFIMLLFSGCKFLKQKNGETINTYYEGGKLKERYTVNSQGIKDGRYLGFYPNGKEQVIANYENGLLGGVAIYYGEKGTKEIKFYKNGLEDSIEMGYYSNATLADQIKYIKGKKQYACSYYPSGKIETYIYYYPLDSLLYGVRYDTLGRIEFERGDFFTIISPLVGDTIFKEGDSTIVKVVFVARPNSTLVLFASYEPKDGPDNWQYLSDEKTNAIGYGVKFTMTVTHRLKFKLIRTENGHQTTIYLNPYIDFGLIKNRGVIKVVSATKNQ